MPARKPSARISGIRGAKATVRPTQGKKIRGHVKIVFGPAGKAVPKKKTPKGGKRMPPARRGQVRKPAQKPKVPEYNIPGQKARFNVRGSRYEIGREPDSFKVGGLYRDKKGNLRRTGKLPTKPRVQGL